MRRKTMVSLAVLGLCLGLPAAALAAFTQFSKISFTGTTHSARSAGVSANIYSAGDELRQVRSVTITFPENTRFRTGTVPACTLTNKQIKNGKQCPSKSQIGTGSAVANALAQDLPASVKAYATGATSMVLVVHASSPPAPAPLTVPIRATTSGRVLTIPVPQLQLSGFNIYLKQLKLSIPKRGTGTHALITSGKCTNGKWIVKSFFRYWSTTDTATTKWPTPCTG